MGVEISQSQHTEGSTTPRYEFPGGFPFLLLMSVILVTPLTLIPLVLAFRLFYFFVMLFEQFMTKIELIVDLIFPFVLFVVLIHKLIENILLFSLTRLTTVL